MSKDDKFITVYSNGKGIYEVIEELNKLAAADDRLEMINKYFKDDQLTLFS